MSIFFLAQLLVMLALVSVTVSFARRPRSDSDRLPSGSDDDRVARLQDELEEVQRRLGELEEMVSFDRALESGLKPDPPPDGDGR